MTNNCKGQKSKIIDEHPFTVHFLKNSNDLSEIEKYRLDTIATYFIKESFKSLHIILKNYSCTDEMEINKYIGMQRSKNIIDYLSEKFKIDRERFYLVDERIKGGNCNDFGRGISIFLIQ